MVLLATARGDVVPAKFLNAFGGDGNLGAAAARAQRRRTGSRPQWPELLSPSQRSAFEVAFG